MAGYDDLEAWSHWARDWARDPLRAGLLRLRIIEDAGSADCGALAQLHDEAFPVGWGESDLAALLDDTTVTTRLIRPISWMGRGPAEGFIMLRQAGDEGEVLTFAVARQARGRGHGMRLLDDGLMGLRQKGVAAVFLEVAETNASALTLYRRRGFLEVGRRPAYTPLADGSRVAALVMRREYR